MTTDTLEFPEIVDPAPTASTAPVEVADEVIDRAELKDSTALVKYSRTEAALIDLRQRFAGAKFDLTTTKGDKAARAARLELVTLRTGLEKKRKELKAPALEIGKKIDSEAARLTAEISALEEPIDAQIKADEKRREEEAKIKAQGDAFRKALHFALIEKIRGYVAAADGLPSERIEKGIAHVEAMQFGAETQELTPQYELAKQDALTGLRKLKADAKTREDLEAQRLENERIAADLKRQADELAAEQRRVYVDKMSPAVLAINWPDPTREPVIVQTAAGDRWGVDPELAPAIQQALTPDAVKPAVIPEVAEAEPVLITTGALNERLEKLTVTADALKGLGFSPVAHPQKKPGVFWRESDFGPIVAALITHLHTVLPEVQ